QVRLPRGFRFSAVARAVDDQFGREDPVIFKKPKEVCIPAEKIPSAPPAGSSVGDFVCYTCSFPPFIGRDVRVTDQFLSQVVRVGKPSRVCVPALTEPPTTTTTTSIVTTTTTASSTTSTTSTSTTTTSSTSSTTVPCVPL